MWDAMYSFASRIANCGTPKLSYPQKPKEHNYNHLSSFQDEKEEYLGLCS